MQKNDFMGFWLTTFFLLGESWKFYLEKWYVNGPCLFSISGFILFDGIGKKARAGPHELNNNYTSRLMTKPTMW